MDVEAILRNAPSLSDNERAALYDAYHIAPDADSLARHIQQFNAPDDVTDGLVEAKQAESQTSPASSSGGTRTADAIRAIADMDPKTLELAESHPHVLNALISEIGRGEQR